MILAVVFIMNLVLSDIMLIYKTSQTFSPKFKFNHNQHENLAINKMTMDFKTGAIALRLQGEVGI